MSPDTRPPVPPCGHHTPRSAHDAYLASMRARGWLVPDAVPVIARETHRWPALAVWAEYAVGLLMLGGLGYAGLLWGFW